MFLLCLEYLCMYSQSPFRRLLLVFLWVLVRSVSRLDYITPKGNLSRVECLGVGFVQSEDLELCSQASLLSTGQNPGWHRDFKIGGVFCVWAWFLGRRFLGAVEAF